jgi:hypothetical protein
MRTSKDEFALDGSVLNGFDYDLQVWVKDGIVQACGHPQKTDYCNACDYAGMKISSIKGHQGETNENA